MKIIKQTNYITLSKSSQVQQSANPLNGKSNASARKAVNNLIFPLTKGLFSDQDWGAVRQVWNALENAGLDWNITDSEYGKDEQGTPSYKIWKFEIRFVNKSGKPTTLHGALTAHGAGSINDPLERYDISVSVF